MLVANGLGIDRVAPAREQEELVGRWREVDLGGRRVDLGTSGELRKRALWGERQRQCEVSELHVEIDGSHATRVALCECDGEI